MSPELKCEVLTVGGGELALAAMDKYQRMDMGRKTYNFVRGLMRNPEYKRMIQERAAQIRAAAEVNAQCP